jgi:hypothetical protein
VDQASRLTLAQIKVVPDSEVLIALGKRRHREQNAKSQSGNWGRVTVELRRPESKTIFGVLPLCLLSPAEEFGLKQYIVEAL